MFLILVLVVGWWAGIRFGIPEWLSRTGLISPFVEQVFVPAKPLPLNQYAITALQSRPYQASELKIEKIITTTPTYTSYLFSYQTLGKKMTGMMNVPSDAQPATGFPVIILLRGYVPAETYTTGIGTKPAATAFVQQGYVTIAPDFLGYGESDPETEDGWEARLQKPLQVIELLATLKQRPQVQLNEKQNVLLNTERLGLWAHSNGGQIALTTLEILRQPIPTTLWAPVTAPFPYSVLFYSDENDDEGKAMRRWVAQFEQDYDVFAFSLTKHLDSLTGPILLHQGTGDEAVPFSWNDEFAQKVELENDRREQLSATESALPEIELTYYRYPGADHNMKPAWNTVIARDLDFFNTTLD